MCGGGGCSNLMKYVDNVDPSVRLGPMLPTDLEL